MRVSRDQGTFGSSLPCSCSMMLACRRSFWQIRCCWLTSGSDEGPSLWKTFLQLFSQLVSYLQFSGSFLLRSVTLDSLSSSRQLQLFRPSGPGSSRRFSAESTPFKCTEHLSAINHVQLCAVWNASAGGEERRPPLQTPLRLSDVQLSCTASGSGGLLLLQV